MDQHLKIENTTENLFPALVALPYVCLRRQNQKAELLHADHNQSFTIISTHGGKGGDCIQFTHDTALAVSTQGMFV